MAGLDSGHEYRITFEVSGFAFDIRNIDDLLACEDTTKNCHRLGLDCFLLNKLHKLWRNTDPRLYTKGPPFQPIEQSAFGAANARGILEHGLEHRRQLSGRA